MPDDPIFEDLIQELCVVRFRDGIWALTEPERNFHTAASYYCEIQNGGPWQYIENSTSDDHRLIIAGLQAIGAPASAQVLADLGKVFGPEGPPEDQDARNEMANSFTPEQEDIIDDLFEIFPSEGENIEMLLNVYAAEHLGDFTHCHCHRD